MPPVPFLPTVPTPTGPQVDVLHGQPVADPYRWLEDTGAPETAAWIGAQNARTEGWLAAVPEREELRARLTEMWDHPRADAPFERGGRWYQWRSSGLQDQATLFVMDGPAAAGRVLLDPNVLSADGTVSVTAASVSDDGELLAYATSEAGSDWRTWRVRETTTGRDRDDVVRWAKFSGAAWRHDGTGFFYSAAERPVAGQEHTGRTGRRRMLFHALGTEPDADEAVFDRPDRPEWSPWGAVADDGDYLVVTVNQGTSRRSRIEVVDLSGAGHDTVVILPDFDCQASYVTNVGRTFYLVTDDRAERRRLVAVDLDRPAITEWREIVPEREAVLRDASNCGGKLLCHYLEDACSRLQVHELDGSLSHRVAVPELSSVADQITRDAGIQGRPGSPWMHFAVQSFTDAGSIWGHDISSGATSPLRASTSPLDAGSLVTGSLVTGSLITERVFVVADDGVRVPVFLTRRRDLTTDGDNPVLLYGYGGFDHATTPWFDRANALFVQRGGLLAVACLRGGGEYGRSWHDAGRRAHKQRVFDDLCDCARWLATSGWSRPARIAINGRSNGGLLVGACLTQHPELFGAAVPEVGVLDMLRFHLFTIGWAWKSDYGDPDDPDDAAVLRAYSPLHNIVPGTAYPPTLVMTGDHDDRVVPGHSLKFAAALQAAQGPDARHPILVRVETSAGHGMGKPTSKVIAERTDMLTFVSWALGRSSA